MSSPKYVFWCASEHQSFRIPEFEALARIFNISLDWVEKNEVEPWVILRLKSDAEAKTLLSRSISAKYCFQLWADEKSKEDFHRELRAYPEELSAPYCKEEQTFKVNVDIFLHKMTFNERLDIIESFDYLPTKGAVKLINPDVTFCTCEFWGHDQNNLSPDPLRLFFGRWLGDGQRDLITKLSIKKRKFIGNTTMDPTLSLLMANLTCTRETSFVLDPFVGTGSLLLAAAQFGAHVLGGDIDWLMLHAKTKPSRVNQKVRKKDESVRANFEQYGLGSQFVGVVVCDASKPLWRQDMKFDSIVTDPPYGIREPTAKVGSKKEDVAKVAEEHLDCHYPQKIEYGLSDIYHDLLQFSATYLEEGGRVAFWVPIVREEYAPEKLPVHPRLRLLANCEQIMSCHTSRRMLLMEKKLSSEPDEKILDSSAGSILPESTADFREHFYAASKLDKSEKRARLSKYGHLNLKGTADDKD